MRFAVTALTIKKVKKKEYERALNLVLKCSKYHGSCSNCENESECIMLFDRICDSTETKKDKTPLEV